MENWRLLLLLPAQVLWFHQLHRLCGLQVWEGEPRWASTELLLDEQLPLQAGRGTAEQGGGEEAFLINNQSWIERLLTGKLSSSGLLWTNPGDPERTRQHCGRNRSRNWSLGGKRADFGWALFWGLYWGSRSDSCLCAVSSDFCHDCVHVPVLSPGQESQLKLHQGQHPPLPAFCSYS